MDDEKHFFCLCMPHWEDSIEESSQASSWIMLSLSVFDSELGFKEGLVEYLNFAVCIHKDITVSSLGGSAWCGSHMFNPLS